MSRFDYWMSSIVDKELNWQWWVLWDRKFFHPLTRDTRHLYRQNQYENQYMSLLRSLDSIFELGVGRGESLAARLC